ncbi:MAG: hypothetical protein HN904_18705 [Victivallales bacterium]|nr:hypothetical protein [Victivallales bacterium]MBT7164817.1 hypothetical protein [Victivallales bacterium]
MTWILVAYLLALVYIAGNRDKFPKNMSLWPAWLWFSLVPVSRFVFALFRAGNMRSVRDLALIEVWADGIGWLLLGLSFLCLADIFERQDK